MTTDSDNKSELQQKQEADVFATQMKFIKFANDLKELLAGAETSGVPADTIFTQLSFWSAVFMQGMIESTKQNTTGMVKQ